MRSFVAFASKHRFSSTCRFRGRQGAFVLQTLRGPFGQMIGQTPSCRSAFNAASLTEEQKLGVKRAAPSSSAQRLCFSWRHSFLPAALPPRLRKCFAVVLHSLDISPELRWLRFPAFLLLAKYFGTRSVTSARARLSNQVLEHLIGQNLPHFLPDQVLEHCSTLFLALFQRARVLVGSMLALARSKGKFGAHSFACRFCGRQGAFVLQTLRGPFGQMIGQTPPCRSAFCD